MRKIHIYFASLLFVLVTYNHQASADNTQDLARGLLIATEKLDTTLTIQEAEAHAEAALTASAATGIDAELLLAMAYYESHYEYGAISRLVCNKGKCSRHTGRVHSRKKPLNVQGKLFCGAIQMHTFSWSRCWWYIDNLDLVYLKGAQHLVEWLKDGRCNQEDENAELTCALKGYRTGNPYSRAIKPIKARLRLRNKIKRSTPDAFESI